jgi:carboxylate-amine ligase
MPAVRTWDEFNRYFDEMQGYGIVASMKDFYWDIRPKPEYGTVEIRICDTPLTVSAAAQLAAYAQTLADDLLRNRVSGDLEPMNRVYGYNRFQACRFGFEGVIVDADRNRHVRIRDDMIEVLERLAPSATGIGTAVPLLSIAATVARDANDSRWMRERYVETKSLTDVVRMQALRWREEPAPA